MHFLKLIKLSNKPMKPEEMENQRYFKDDNCRIMLEEKIMFNMLERWRRKIKKEKSSIEILDLGCGSGLITKKIKDLGYQIRGLDFSQEAINKAKGNGIDANLCNLDEGIKGDNEEFDVVWAGDIIEHVFDPIGLLREVNRVLRRNGIVIISIPSDVGLITRLKVLFGISYQTLTYKKHGFFKHHTFFTLRLIEYMLRKNGFKIQEKYKILNTGQKRFSSAFLPSFLYNELVIMATK